MGTPPDAPPIESSDAVHSTVAPRLRPLRLLRIGVLGLLAAVALAGVLEGALRLLGSEGRVPTSFFVVVAALTPVLTLGLLAQIVAGLAGRAGALLREVKRFDEEMSAEPPVLDDESDRARRLASESGERFLRVVVLFGAALILQALVTEIVAILCIALDIHGRFVALALGIEVVAMLLNLLFFTPVIRRLSSRGRTA